MKRIQSEAREPGMQPARHCPDCGDLLPPDGHERCITCGPVLSQLARDVGAERRREREEIEATERQINSLEIMIRRTNRRLRHADARKRD
jgi:hypothetical protein